MYSVKHINTKSHYCNKDEPYRYIKYSNSWVVDVNVNVNVNAKIFLAFAICEDAIVVRTNIKDNTTNIT
jgi:hypothetical protein